MKGFNVIVVLDETGGQILMCRRRKPPYRGLLNLVGGKIEPGEDGAHAAYRELQEETGITREDIVLTHLMDFTYCLTGVYLECYVGQLRRPFEVFGDENELLWVGVEQDFFDLGRFAGDGNLGHILEHVRLRRDQWAR